MFHFESIPIWTSEFTKCVTPKKECCLVAIKALLLIFISLIISSIKGYARARMLALEWKERALNYDKGNFRQPYWWSKTDHQYGVSIEISTNLKARETFRQMTLQKLWATKTWHFHNLFLYIGLLWKFHFLAFFHWTVSNLFFWCRVYCVTVKTKNRTHIDSFH